jgi:hypothetical protein
MDRENRDLPDEEVRSDAIADRKRLTTLLD